MEAGQQALDLAVELGDRALQGQAFYNLGQANYAIGNFSRAAELLRQNVEAADRESGRPSAGWHSRTQARLAQVLSVLGDFAEGRRHGEEALRLATLYAKIGRCEQAHAELSAAIDLYRAMEMTSWLP